MNPYTGLAYADDPAIVTVQMNNEESAIKGDMGADMTEQMKPYRDEVQRRFNHFLLAKVTVIGSSAGAKAAASLMLIPESQTLFQKAILSSGGLQSVRDTATAGKVADQFMEVLDVDDAEKLLSLPTEELRQAQLALCDKLRISVCVFGPVADGAVISKNYRSDAERGAIWKGKAVVGSCRNELAYLSAGGPAVLAAVDMLMHGFFGAAGEQAKEAYQRLSATAENDEGRIRALVKVLSDGMYRTHSYRLADILSAAGSDVYLFSFDFPPATHILDHMLAFENEDMVSGIAPEDKEAAKELGETIRKEMLRFIRGGDPTIEGEPAWTKYGEKDRRQMVFDRTRYMAEVGEDEEIPFTSQERLRRTITVSAPSPSTALSLWWARPFSVSFSPSF